MYFLIWKNLLHRKLTVLSLALCLAVSVAIIFAITTIYSGVTSGLELFERRLGADIVVIPHDAVMEPSLILFGGAPANIYMPENMVNSIQSIPGVKQVTPQFFT